MESIFKQVFFISILLCSIVFAQSACESEQKTELTIYGNNFAVVRQHREVAFEQGLNTIKFDDIASAIDPTTVSFECISGANNVLVLEQNYQYDIINTPSLLRHYIGENITVSVKGSGSDAGRRIAGVLMASVDENLILRTGPGGIEIINRTAVENISLESLPRELTAKPTLVLLCDVKEAGKQLCRLAYHSRQIGWSANYSVILNEDGTKADLQGWVTIDNKSGADYKDAEIKLIAGDVGKVPEQHRIRGGRMYAAEVGAAPDAGFVEKPFAEYHLYKLGRKSTIANMQSKQIQLIEPAGDIAVKKVFIYDRQKNRDKVQVKIEFENTDKNNLGIPLPAGQFRLYKKDAADETAEFIGVDRIDHTAKNKKVSASIGNAFDIVPKYTLTDTTSGRRVRTESHKIELSNRKNQAVVVYVDEKFAGRVNWQIDKASHKYKKHDANTARFEIKIVPDSTVTLEYTATQTW